MVGSGVSLVQLRMKLRTTYQSRDPTPTNTELKIASEIYSLKFSRVK